MKTFSLYVADTETTGLSDLDHSIIEISILRVNDNVQRTWCIAPHRFDTIQMDALRINGHRIEDLKHLTEYGKNTYKSARDVIPDIENFFADDAEPAENRILVGQNPGFDLGFMQEMWKREGSLDMFPFGSRPFTLDTRQIQVFLDLAFDEAEDYYNLGSLIKRYGVKNTKAHTAAADTLATKEVFMGQLNKIKKLAK